MAGKRYVTRLSVDDCECLGGETLTITVHAARGKDQRFGQADNGWWWVVIAIDARRAGQPDNTRVLGFNPRRAKDAREMWDALGRDRRLLASVKAGKWDTQ